MKERLFVLLMLTTLYHPALAEQIQGYEISVEISSKHPFLTDHKRTLLIKRHAAKIANEELYSDAGSRIPLHVYQDDNAIVFIDANGYWYRLLDTRLKNLGWQWKKSPPTNYLGTFRLRESEHKQTFKKENTPKLKEVYLFKDPL